MKNSLSKNTFFYLIYNVLNIAFPLITGIYVARVLLPVNIGEIETARNLANYFVIFSLLGIPTYALRECSKLRDDKKGLSKLCSELFVINTISVAIFLVSYVSIVFIIEAYREHIWLYLITGASIALNFLFISWLYEGLEKFDFISIRNIIFKIVCFVLLIVFVRGPKDAYTYAIISVAGTAGNYVINFVFIRKHVKLSFSNLNIKRHLKPILILALTNLAIELYSMVDITMLSWMCSKESVAYYSYAARIKSILITMLNTFTIVIVPRLASLFKQKKVGEYITLIKRVLYAILFFSIPMIIGIWFVSDYVLTAVYGPSYIASSSILKILSFVLIISPVGYLLGSRICLTTGHEEKMVFPVGFGAITNIVLNYFLIKCFAENGAALASVISEIVVAVIYLCISKRYCTISIEWKNIVRILIPSVLMLNYLLFTINWASLTDMAKCLVQVFGALIVFTLSSILLKEETAISLTKKIANILYRGKGKKV